ncbi:3-hydroxyisobutyryl-CoA hydrolase 1-like isoform X1 [Syzygium oleosum]|uniref:3-hydroxyisobutyryl-CoA hydrolase 1-like isoform X1 n=1 Tax=Syzygium oleosum TaxID=219896 RepID=UPI0024BABB1B|nr:3-hydroxyisobutyryl-CoA hydrolase 1-like isoform X1 [Syzygium oleosum]
MAFRCSFNLEDDDQVLFEEISSVRKVILNRPTKLNCLTYEMVVQMLRALEAYECDPAVECITLKGKGKAFCSGGDVKGFICSSGAGHWSFAGAFYRSQLMLDYLIATYSKPVIALVDGIVMGGGAGLAMHAAFRVVTENTVFAMPEASIGLFPDVGASKFLSKLPGSFGEYLALTGARLDGGEMLACGLASHFVLSKDLPLLEKSVCEEAPLKKSTISDLLNRFAHKTSLKENSTFRRLEIINRCFSKPTVEEILSSLENEVENDGEKKWIKDAIRSMRSASPTSLKITLKSMREGRAQTIEQCLAHEYTISCHMFRRSMHRDFYEGSRAMLFDKDRKPQYSGTRPSWNRSPTRWSASSSRVSSGSTRIGSTCSFRSDQAKPWPGQSSEGRPRFWRNELESQNHHSLYDLFTSSSSDEQTCFISLECCTDL